MEEEEEEKITLFCLNSLNTFDINNEEAKAYQKLKELHVYIGIGQEIDDEDWRWI